MNRTSPIKALLFAALLLSCVLSSLGAQSLYGSGIPAEAALVRCVQLAPSGKDTVYVGATPIPLNGPETASPYYPVGPGLYFVAAGNTEAEVFARSGGYYTLVLTRDGLTAFEDIAHDDPVRCQIYLYNLSDESCTLTADGAGPVFKGLPPGQSRQIAVNPLEIGFTLTGEGEGASGGHHWDSLPLERGGSVSLFFYGDRSLAAEARVETQG